jgi:HK97 gp10 family phage protein
MARWGRTDFKQLKALQKRMDLLSKADTEEFSIKIVKELAARLLRKVKARTPIGDTQTLRNGWKVLDVTKKGDLFTVVVLNTTFYASYVEFGHRTNDHKGWVNGQFYLTISENELEREKDKIIERKMMKLLGSVLDGE